jgi:hypothetical protein
MEEAWHGMVILVGFKAWNMGCSSGKMIDY